MNAKRNESQHELQEEELVLGDDDGLRPSETEDDWYDVEDSEEQREILQKLAPQHNLHFKGENDRTEALQYNGQDLPQDFLMA